MNEIDGFIEGLPKAELHLHIEGSLEPEQMFALAERNGVAIPFATVDEVRNAYSFADLQSFLDIYYQGMQVLVTEQDFFDLTWAYLAKARSQNVRHAEIFFDPQAHTGRGVPFACVVDGIGGALDRAQAELGLSSRLIMCFLRDRSEEEALATLQSALDHRERIAGVGLDSAERGNPPEKFAEVFEQARAAGFRAVAHAGEEGPAAYVRDALDLLGAERIDHGVRALEDAALVARLAAAAVPLTVCPLSNVCLKVVETMRQHPLDRLLDAGLLVTINSDDPAYFGGYVNENFAAVASAFALDRAALAQLARNSFAASFLDDAAKAALISEVDAYEAAAGRS